MSTVHLTLVTSGSVRITNPTLAGKFVRRSNIDRDISNQNYLKDTILLNKMTSFSLYFFKLCHETDVTFGGTRKMEAVMHIFIQWNVIGLIIYLLVTLTGVKMLISLSFDAIFSSLHFQLIERCFVRMARACFR